MTDYADHDAEIDRRTSKSEAQRLLPSTRVGETTHFSVADADGTAVVVTQSIASYFGAKAVHPTLEFLYSFGTEPCCNIYVVGKHRALREYCVEQLCIVIRVGANQATDAPVTG